VEDRDRRRLHTGVCGVQPANVFALYGNEATKGDLDDLFGSRLPLKVKENGTVYVYFAGHGTPGKDKQPLLVPWDATADAEAKLYPVERIVEQANSWKAKRTVVMLDVCFAGVNRALAPTGRPLVPVDMSQLAAGDKCVVLTASGANQTANDFGAVKHGLFTYYLLKALKGDADKDGDGWVTGKELYDYVRENVSNDAADQLQAEQVPSILPAGIEQTGSGWKMARSR